MKILYIHQYFRTPAQGGALRSFYLSQALQEAGHTVELITAYNGTTYQKCILNGVTVHYLPVPYNNSFGFRRRLGAFLKFSWQSIRLAFRIKHLDLCFATSTPLTVGLPALLLKVFRGLPYYFEVRDLWPEAPVQLGYIRNPLLKTLLFWFEKVLYRHAEKIIALSPGMVQGIKRYGLKTPVYLLPNMADCRFFRPDFKAPGNSFLISYAGTIGRANQLEFLLLAAKACQEANLANVRFAIAGTGAELEKLKASAQAENLTNLEFMGHLNREEVHALLNRSQATYTSFDVAPVLETNSPNKFFEALAAGKLCIVNTQGWLKELVEKNNCGFYANPQEPAIFVQKLLPFLENQDLLLAYQQNARNLAETEFSREKISREFVQLFGPSASQAKSAGTEF